MNRTDLAAQTSRLRWPSFALLLVPLFAASCLEIEGDGDDDQLSVVESALTTGCNNNGQRYVCRAKITMPSGAKVPYYRNHALNVPNAAITHAVIVIHGNSRTPWTYFDYVVDAVPSSRASSTLVIAPEFQFEADAVSGELWWDGNWKEGSSSGGYSSFDVTDTVVERLRENGSFPNLRWIVVTGHSAGGQYTQRYAALTEIDLTTGPYMKFVPVNAGTYMYLDGRRPIGDGYGYPSQCQWPLGQYNDYKYGLDDRYGYANRVTAAEIRTNVRRRWVEYLLGESDTQRVGDFDGSCAADKQGDNRYARGLGFYHFMDMYYPGAHVLGTVPGVGHSANQMYNSAAGKAALFFD